MELRTRAKTAYGLLRDIQRLILEEPLRIDMSVVCIRGKSLEYDRSARLTPSCGTVGCIAGWTEVLTGNTEDNELNLGSLHDAQVILGLTHGQARDLFTDDHLIFDKNKQTPAHAQKVSAHISKFIKVNERQLKNHKIVVKQ